MCRSPGSCHSWQRLRASTHDLHCGLVRQTLPYTAGSNSLPTNVRILCLTQLSAEVQGGDCGHLQWQRMPPRRCTQLQPLLVDRSQHAGLWSLLPFGRASCSRGTFAKRTGASFPNDRRKVLRLQMATLSCSSLGVQDLRSSCTA